MKNLVFKSLFQAILVLLSSYVFAQCPKIFAGENIPICYNQSSIQLTGYVPQGIVAKWTTTGKGTFLPSNTVANAIYRPAKDENMNIAFSFTSIPTDACPDGVSDTIYTIVKPNTTIDLGADIFTCNAVVPILKDPSLDTTISKWSTSGTGTFSADGMGTRRYNASAADVAAGQVSLLAMPKNHSYCSAIPDTIKINFVKNIAVTIVKKPTVICDATTFTATSSNASDINWTSNATDTILAKDTASLFYVPSATAIAKGKVMIYATVSNSGRCTAVKDSFEVILKTKILKNIRLVKEDFATGELQLTLATNQGVQPLGLMWSTDGSGVFSLINSLNNKYIYTLADVQRGVVNITVTANNPEHCGAERMTQLFAIKGGYFLPLKVNVPDGQVANKLYYRTMIYKQQADSSYIVAHNRISTPVVNNIIRPLTNGKYVVVAAVCKDSACLSLENKFRPALLSPTLKDSGFEGSLEIKDGDAMEFTIDFGAANNVKDTAKGSAVGRVVWGDLSVNPLLRKATEPVYGAVISVFNRWGENIGSAITDTDGKFLIKYLSTGVYVYTISYPNIKGIVQQCTITKTTAPEDLGTIILPMNAITSVEVESEKTVVSIAPNPANDEVSIAVNGSDIQKVSIYTGLGTAIDAPIWYSKTNAKVNVAALTNGLYTIAITQKNSRISYTKMQVMH